MMLLKIHSQDSSCKGNCKCNCITPEESLELYKQAAEYDEYLFGDYDYCKEWVGITTLDV